MKEKSVERNAVLNSAKTILKLILPLITFPYISRILQVENLGKINYVKSIVDYFVLFATLGVQTYGIREGASVRNDKIRFQELYSQLFTSTLITTFLSLVGLFFVVQYFEELRQYAILFLIFSIIIILSCIGNEWVCSAYEDYTYITVRTIAVQLLSFVLIFVLIHKKEDYYRYAIILTFSSAGSNIFNFIYNKKYVKHKLTKSIELKKHLQPLLVLFASSLAITIYISSDTIILGLLAGDYYTGIYAVVSKIYVILKNIISSIVVVFVPRLSYYYKNNLYSEYCGLLSRLLKIIIIIILPMSMGIIMLSKEIILLISGVSYIEAALSLKVLAISLIFIAVSWIFSQCILIPIGLEKNVLYTTVGTAALNVILNCLWIGRWKQDAAACTTLISEAVVTLSYFIMVKNKLSSISLIKTIKHAICACMVIVILISGLRLIINNSIILLLVSVVSSIIAYFISLLMMKEEIINIYMKNENDIGKR